jgi:hypothetical protein
MRCISRRAIRRARVLPKLSLVSFSGPRKLGIGIAGFVEGRGRALVGKLGDGRGGAGVVFQFGNEIWYALDWGVTITFHFHAYYSKHEKT